MFRQILTTALSVAALWTTGCGSAVTTTPTVTTSSTSSEMVTQSGTTASASGVALVRFINADPSGTALEVLAGTQHLFGGIAYKGIAAYVEAPRGMTQFNVRKVDEAKNLSSARRELLPGRHYTIIAFPEKKMGIRLQVTADNLGLLEPGTTRVRLVNATADVDDLDLFRQGNANHILHGIDSGTGATMAYAEMEGGEVEIRQPNRPAPTLVSKYTLEANRLYTFIVVGTSSSLETIQVIDALEP